MTNIQKFIEFAKTLSVSDRANIEDVLESIMNGHVNQFRLTDTQEEDIERRIADPNNTIVPHEEIEAICGRPMPR